MALPVVAYNFELYHWRRRLRSVLAGIAAGVVGVAVWRFQRTFVGRVLATGLICAGVVRVSKALDSLLSPAPWSLERYKYDALGLALPLNSASRLLDVGCGTGRSLVGLAPSLPHETTVIGVDVFDDRVILGNGPQLARRNAAHAGLDVQTVRGDVASLPVATGSVDVVTACRVLHDLPQKHHQQALQELRRVCASDGHLGVLELPIAPDSVDQSPADYWYTRIEAAGFELETAERITRRRGGDPYILVIATPE